MCSSNYHLGKNKVEHRTPILRTLPPPYPPPPPNQGWRPQKPKRAIFPSLIWRGGAGGTNFLSISSTIVAPNLGPNPYRLFPNCPKPLFFKKGFSASLKKRESFNSEMANQMLTEIVLLHGKYNTLIRLISSTHKSWSYFLSMNLTCACDREQSFFLSF